MPLFFEILEDDQVKATHKIRKGLRIGRTKGEILLNDTKVSGLHAVVEENDKGQYFLIDKNSSNGIRVNDRRVPRALLLSGITVQVGRSSLRVVELDQEEYAPKPVEWKEALQKILSEKAADISRDPEKVAKPLRPALTLSFVEGVQLDTEWTIGFGPRSCGLASLDLPIYEDNLPEMAFQLVPDEMGHPVFKTDHPDLVTYNGQSQSEARMNRGDTIQLGKTKIRVDLVD